MSDSTDDAPRHDVAVTYVELLSLCWKIVRRQYLPVLICLLLAIPAGVAYLVFVPANYAATALLLIDTRKGQFSPDRSVLGETPIDTSWVQTQLEILVSDGVLATVVKDLRLAEHPEFNTSLGRVARTLKFVGLNIPSSEPQREPEATERAISALRRQVHVNQKGPSWIIEIMARSSNANLAAKIANAVADAYIGKHRQWKVEAARHASDWLQTRLQTLSEQSSAAEKAVLNFKAANNIVAASGKLLNDQQLSDLNTQLAGARTGAASAQARLNRIEAVLGAREPTSGVAATVTDALNNPIITRLRTQYLELASRQADYAARFGANHEAVVNLRKQVADLQASMRSELGRIAETYKSEYVIAIERQKELEKRVAEQIADSQQVNKAEITLRQLESTARNYRTLHDMFLQRYGESQQSVVTDEARVISPASPPGAPSSPKPLLVGALTILGGLAAGAALGLLRELLDNVFRTGESVPAAIGTECLAVVPALKSERGSLLRVVGANADARRVYPPILRRRSRRGGAAFRSGGETTYVHFAEAIGAIRLALSFNKKAMDDKIIGITSSLPGEGKSTIAASLARAVAETGARTILVDADLRKPTLSRSLVPNAKCGLMEVIQGTSALDNAIWTDPDTKLDFLPYIGSTPATPVIDIFSTTTIEQIFERLRAEYEYVFVDLCPLLPVIDVRSTTDLCDAYLFVVEWGRTDINLVKHSLSTAPRVWEKLAGAVLNRADFSRLAKFGRGASTYDSEYLRTYRDRELAPIGQLVPAPKGRISAMRRIEEQTS